MSGRFSQSLGQFRMLSELYANDCADSVLLPEYPSSNSDETNFRNTTRFVIHDPDPPPARHLMKVLGPHHLMCCWGGKLPVTSEIGPPRLLVDHWKKVIGPDCELDWLPYDGRADYLTIYPHESVSAERQVIEPAVYHRLHSKRFIDEVNCSRPKTFGRLQFPCVIKLSFAYAGLGNYFVNNDEEAAEAIAKIESQWPGADYVATQIIDEIIGDFGVQFYLKKGGAIQWLGFTEQEFDANRKWSGGKFDIRLQDKLADQFAGIVEAVAKSLHSQGYFGVVGVDILKTSDGNCYLVDINPRLTGITPFLVAARNYCEDGLTHGIYQASVHVSGSAEELIEKAEAIVDGKLVVLAFVEQPGTGTLICHLGAHGRSTEACLTMLGKVRR